MSFLSMSVYPPTALDDDMTSPPEFAVHDDAEYSQPQSFDAEYYECIVLEVKFEW